MLNNRTTEKRQRDSKSRAGYFLGAEQLYGSKSGITSVIGDGWMTKYSSKRRSDDAEALRLQRECGLWLRGLREAAGLSQREISIALGGSNKYYMSQFETTRRKIPAHQIRDFARLFRVPPRDFARNLMRYYDPLNYEILFSAEDDQNWSPPEPKPPERKQRSRPSKAVARPDAEVDTEALADRVRRLEDWLLPD